LNKYIYLLIAVILISTSIFSGCIPKLKLPATSTAAATGGTLNLTGVDPLTLDPAFMNEAGSASYIVQIFNGLLKMGDNMEPAPDIAESLPAVSPEGLTYTFHLRQDVKFQDGKALKAADIKYSWERAANPATKSPTAGTYLGDIVGVKDELGGKSNQISGVKIINDSTLQVTIDSPKSYFLYKLTYPATFIVDQNNVASSPGWSSKPNGTGPFRVQEWTKEASLTLARNNLYYGEKAKLSQVNFQYNNTSSDMDLYETSQIDLTGAGTAYYDKIMDKTEPFYSELYVSPNLSLDYVGFNISQPPFDDINVRRAFSLAIDKDKIITLVYRGMAQKANGILPPGMPGYNQNLVGIPFNINQAKASIAASKYGEVSRLPPITLTFSGEGGSAGPLLQSLVYQWKQNLGVDVKIRQIEPQIAAGNFAAEVDQMYYFSWIADYPHPQDFLDILFHSGSSYNYGQYADAEVDALIQQANQTLDPKQGFTLYQQAEQKIVDDAACLPMSFGKNYILIQPYLKGYTINPLGFATLDKVSVLTH
jgi:oligopeptide transport system substrate-binding protein